MISSMDGTSVRLGLWTELVGKLSNFYEDAHFLHLKVDDKTVTFAIDSEEANCIRAFALDKFLGRIVALLRTDLPKKPILIRLVPINGQQFSL